MSETANHHPTIVAAGCEKEAASEFLAALSHVIAELLKAHEYAMRANRDPWDLAVEIDELRTRGATETDLRWLVCEGYVEHAREVTKVEDDSREFEPMGKLSFADRTCFVLTAAGVSFARAHSWRGIASDPPPPRTPIDGVGNR
jgi:hypothetical protein